MELQPLLADQYTYTETWDNGDQCISLHYNEHHINSTKEGEKKQQKKRNAIW